MGPGSGKTYPGSKGLKDTGSATLAKTFPLYFIFKYNRYFIYRRYLLSTVIIIVTGRSRWRSLRRWARQSGRSGWVGPGPSAASISPGPASSSSRTRRRTEPWTHPSSSSWKKFTLYWFMAYGLMISKYICFWRWRSSLFFVYKRWSRQLSQSPWPASFFCRQGCGSDPFMIGSGSVNVKRTLDSFWPRRTDLKSRESVNILSQQRTTSGADIQRGGSILAWIEILSVYGADTIAIDLSLSTLISWLKSVIGFLILIYMQ